KALMLEDKDGDRIVFVWDGSAAVEQPVPEPASVETVNAFLRAHHVCPDRPRLRTFEEITHWWLINDNPLTYQQALGFSDTLYRYFLTHVQYTDEQILSIVQKKLVTEDEYLGIKLWYLDGNSGSAWLGPLGLDGTGEIYGLTLRYRTPEQVEYAFYLENEYYRFMNKKTNVAPC
nr:hypothetical protein [Oscillospiraceae bacterium]